MLLKKSDEIAVFGEHNDSGVACRRKDFVVVCITKSDLSQRECRDRNIGADPARDPWRQMGVHPYRHAARTGWSTRRRAKVRHAFKSSDSKSGISSRICAASGPAAK